MILSESIENAVLKLKESKKSYDWILRNYDNADEVSDDYRKNFNTMQGAFSAADILLRCVLIKRHIPIWKKDGKNYCERYITEQDDGVKIYAKQAICAIAYYNSQHRNQMILSDVDFSCLIGENKETRNLDEHLGKRGTMQDMYRVLFNLDKILYFLEGNMEGINILPNRHNETFDFSRFDGCVHSFDEDERRYILIADSMHNVPREQLTAFLSMPWSMILDFDGTSAFGGLKEVLEQNAETIKHNEYLYNDFDINNTISFFSDRVVYIPICDEDGLRTNIIPTRGNLKKDAQNASQISMKLRDTLHPFATFVVTGNMTERMGNICSIIKDEFVDIDIIYLTSQDKENRALLQYIDDDDLDGNENPIGAYFFDSSIFDVMSSIYNNRKLLPQKKIALFNESIGYTFPLSINKRVQIQNMMEIERLEKSFEFVHLNVGNDEHGLNKNDFFHGNIASWETIKYKNVPFLMDTEDFQKSILNGESRCFYLYHLPGFGGTTLGRLICWNLHETIPTIWLRHMDNESELIRNLRDISKMLKNHAFVLFIDENDFSAVNMQEIEKIVEYSELRFYAVFIYRISMDEAQNRKRKKSRKELILSLMEIKYKEKLLSECMDLLKAQNQEAYYDSRKESMEANLDERDQCALLINLYLLEKDFKLDTYVRGFLHHIPDDLDGQKIKNILIFTAIGAYFSNLKIPFTYYSQYMKFGQKDVYINKVNKKSSIENFLQPYDGLFLHVKNNGVKLFGIKHFLIAREMLRQLLSTSKDESWKGHLDVAVCNFVDMLESLLLGMSKMDDTMEEMIMCLFTDKTRSRYIEEEVDDYNSRFTSLFNAMNDSQRLNAINYISTKLESFIFKVVPKGKKRREYKVLAHIYAVHARIFSKNQLNNYLTDKEKEAQNEQLQELIMKTIQLIEAEELYEYDLEHMLGMCHLEFAESILDVNEKLDKAKLNGVLSEIDKAIEHFNRTIWYGSPDYGFSCKIRAINCGLRGIVNCFRISRDELIPKLNSIEKARSYRLQGINAIHDMPEYDMSTKGRVFAEKQRARFDEICSSEDSSRIIERLEDLRIKLRQNDYEGQYVISTQMIYEYEKKYKVGNMTGSGSLIRKAIKGNKKAKNDARKVFEHLDRIVQNNIHSVSYSTYNLWFEYAKYMEISLDKAREVALAWKNNEIRRNNSNERYRGVLVRPYYYLFVISLLSYLEQKSISAQDVVARKTELENVRDKNYRYGTVQDWFANRKNMGRLYSREWIDISDVDDESCIAEVRGKVVYLDEKTSGYLHITSPLRLSTWTKPPKGKSYNRDCDVYFRLPTSNAISSEDVGSNIEKKFKFGFSYERALASQKSIENRNAIETVVIDGDKQNE